MTERDDEPPRVDRPGEVGAAPRSTLDDMLRSAAPNVRLAIEQMNAADSPFLKLLGEENERHAIAHKAWLASLTPTERRRLELDRRLRRAVDGATMAAAIAIDRIRHRYGLDPLTGDNDWYD